MASDRLYKKDQYEIQNSAKVLEVATIDGCDSIACDRSVFFPEGGGQPSDTGTVARGDKLYNVLCAEDKSLEDDVWHHTDAPAGTFHPGDEVVLTIDWDRRFINMQRHLGEHMLSGTFHTLFGGVNKGFHMGEEYITIDIDMDGRMLTDEELDLAERTVNDAIWSDLPVSIDYFENYQASLVMPVRKQVPHEGEVSVVTVGELPDPYDCIACCGTHPSSTAQVGLLAIYKHEPNKGMNRIYFDCGSMAKEHLSRDMKQLTAIADHNSCKTSDLIHKLQSDEEATRRLKAQMAAMATYTKNAEKTRILEHLNEQQVVAYELDLLSVDDLLKLGFAVISETENKLLMLLHAATGTVLLFSSAEAKCGSLVKEYASEFGGRGGGRDDNARAVFANDKDMKAFADKLTEVLK